jgi:hypothetical protein
VTLNHLGIFHTAARWDFHSSHRDRLSSFAKDRSGEKHQDPVLVDRREESGVVRESWDHQELVTKYLHVGLVQKVSETLIWRSEQRLPRVDADLNPAAN